MQDDVWGPLFTFVVATLIVILVSSFKRLNLGFRLWGIPPMRKEHKKILKKYCRFYNELDVEEKAVFEKRVQYFIKAKTFIPRNMDHITMEMKLLIAATAIQLVFGYPNVYLTHFKRILIYPDNYYSTINKVYHQGEVNPLNRIIVLSWKNFVKGVIENESGINLGLHEMAHALRLENIIRNNEYNFLDHAILQLWEELAAGEIQKIKAGNETIFRKYGAASEEEFFAVAIENFFERPGLFKAYHQELYDILARLLRQGDPLDQ